MRAQEMWVVSRKGLLHEQGNKYNNIGKRRTNSKAENHVEGGGKVRRL